MNTFNFAPLMHSPVGFDRFEGLFEQAFRNTDAYNVFPHYDIEKTDESKYYITMAVAGYSEDDVGVTQKENLLVVRGALEKGDGNFLHRGISTHKFERCFHLADYVEVDSASIENGLLAIELVRNVPEALRPRIIKITSKKPLLEKVKDKVAA